VGLEIGGEIDKGPNQSNKDISLQISILGDIVPKADSYPTTVEGVVQLMRQVPEFIKGVNKGKGSVLQYKLESIDKVRDHFVLEAMVVSIINTISSGQIDQVKRIFDTIVENRIRLNEAPKDILEYKQYITASEVKRINMELKSIDR
ncbi:hypothetical protein BGZ65_001178, partial [Modicella reniformis]